MYARSQYLVRCSGSGCGGQNSFVRTEAGIAIHCTRASEVKVMRRSGCPV